MSKPVNEYDQRQYRLMLEQIEKNLSGGIDLGHLRSGLEFLLNALESAEAEWKASFIKSWAVLEMAYANIVTKGLVRLSDEEEKAVQDAVFQLKSLIEQPIKDSDGGR